MTSVHLTGRVKWFNKKSGFGFLTVCNNNEFASRDIFAHYTSLVNNYTQYKYLVQGEYVEFDLVSSTNDKHEFIASNIRGMFGGYTMCDTHFDNPISSPHSNVVSQPQKKHHVKRLFPDSPQV